MEKRSYKFGELKAKLQESASEFKPVFGNGVESKEKQINRQANNEIQKAAADYDGGLSNTTEKKTEVHFDQPRNGMSSLQYDGELSKEYKDRVQANLRGFTSKQEMDAHAKEPHGNATFDDAIAKELERLATVRKKEQDAESEVGITNVQKPKDKTHRHNTNIGEGKKINVLKFKKVQFISESHMLSHVPDEYKNEGNVFYMQDCNGDKYLVEWHKKPEVVKQLNEASHKAEMDRIKYLFGYNGKNSNTTNAMRMNEDKNIADMLGKVRKLMK